MNTESKLFCLFDSQRFFKNPQLERLICEAENHSDNQLSDDDIAGVNAAGEVTDMRRKLKDGDLL